MVKVKKTVGQLKYLTIAMESWYNCIMQQSLLTKDKNKIYFPKFLTFNNSVSVWTKVSAKLLRKSTYRFFW